MNRIPNSMTMRRTNQGTAGRGPRRGRGNAAAGNAHARPVHRQPARGQRAPNTKRRSRAFAPDLILSDYTLPGFDGTEALQIARSRRPDTPFIFVSGTIGEERAIQALKQGAVDYVLKDNRARLVPAIERALREAEDRDARRWAQRELEESEERFRFAMHFSSIGMALVAPDGRWLGVNPALCDIVGYSESELLATDVQSITYPDDRDADAVQVRQMLDRSIETYQTNKRYVRKDGRVVWTQLSGSLVWLQSGEPHYFIYQIQDITDRVSAERALRASEERFRSIAEATQEWIWEIDADGLYTFCSPAVEAILGLCAGSADRQAAASTSCRRASGKPWPTCCGAESRKSAAGATWCCICSTPPAAFAGSTATRCRCSIAPAMSSAYRGVARDITHHRLQQERIARLSRIQAVLSGINSTIVRVRERRELLRESCRIAVQQGGFRMAWIGLVEPGALKATPLVWEGFEQGYLQEIGLTLGEPRGRSGPRGRGAAPEENGGRERHRSRLRSHLLKQQALARGFRSQMAMPLMVEDQAVGVLVLYAAETGFFDYEELKLLKDLAGDISFALDYIGKEEKLTYVSYYDTLTGLANRQLFFDRLAQALHSARAEASTARGHDHRRAALQADQRHLGTLRRRPGPQGTRGPAAAHDQRVRDPGAHRRRSLRGGGPQSCGNLDGALDRRMDRRLVRGAAHHR